QIPGSMLMYTDFYIFDWQEALTFCYAHQARLPTEIELEYSAHGPGIVLPTQRPHPIGISWVGALFGTYYWEWTSTIYNPKRFPAPYQADDGRENLSDTNAKRVRLGGPDEDFRSPTREGADPISPRDILDYQVSFRCVHDFGTKNS